MINDINKINSLAEELKSILESKNVEFRKSSLLFSRDTACKFKDKETGNVYDFSFCPFNGNGLGVELHEFNDPNTINEVFQGNYLNVVVNDDLYHHRYVKIDEDYCLTHERKTLPEFIDRLNEFIKIAQGNIENVSCKG